MNVFQIQAREVELLRSPSPPLPAPSAQLLEHGNLESVNCSSGNSDCPAANSLTSILVFPPCIRCSQSEMILSPAMSEDISDCHYWMWGYMYYWHLEGGGQGYNAENQIHHPQMP